MAKATTYAQEGPVIGYFEVSKVVREGHPIHQGGDQTIGQMIDGELNEAAGMGSEITELKVCFERETWLTLAEALRKSLRPTEY